MKRLLDWYWNFGIQRSGDYQINLGNWLFPLMDLAQRDEAAVAALSSRSAIGIWGPSQSGKSILLSRYLDGEDPYGTDSALSWDGGTPCRFSQTPQTPLETLCLNPRTEGVDASGVVARYVACDSIPDPAFPVKLTLSQPFHWIYAFAIGYMELCEQRIVTYDAVGFNSLLEGFDDPAAESAPPNRRACETLACLSEIISAFIDTRKERFANLGIDNDWTRSLRTQMLNTKALNRNNTLAEQFMAEVLWNNEPIINSVISKIRYFQDYTTASWRKKPIYCSLEVAQLLLNFQTLEICRVAQLNTSPASEVERIQLGILNRVRKMSWRDNGKAILIGLFDEGNPIGIENFGPLQTLTAELQIPLRLDRINNEVFRRLIPTYDLIDFPGVTNKAGRDGITEKINFASLNDDQSEHLLFTEISKYGKTLSLVYSHSKSLAIDAFLILMKPSTEQIFGKSACIQTGLQKWWSELGYSSSREAPLFVDFSFFASAFELVSGTVDHGFDKIIQTTLEQLPFARDPGNVRMFVTNYPWLTERFSLKGMNRERIFSRASQEPLFSKFIPEWKRNFDAVFEDGGEDYMLSSIVAALDTDKRRNKIRALMARDLEQMVKLVTSKLPSRDNQEAEHKRQIVQNVISALQSHLNEGLETSVVATFLKKLMFVDAGQLDMLPINVPLGNQNPFAEYLKKQFNIWVENKITQFDESDAVWNYLFNQDAEGLESFRLFLRTMEEGTNKALLLDWLLHTMDNITSKNVANRAKSLFALGMSNLLWTGSCTRKRQEEITEDVINERLKLFSQQSLDPQRYSIARIQILDPFIERCKKLAEGDIQKTFRKKQPGDDELAELLENVRNNK